MKCVVEVEAFSPGVIKLFGEHAVVYGYPAVAVAVDRGVRAVCRDGTTYTRIRARAVISGVAEFDGERAYADPSFFAYVNEAIRLTRDWGVTGVDIELVSDFPPSVGAATSAATVGAVIRCIAELTGRELRPEELAELVYRVELRVQGAASRMDSSVTALGGIMLVRGDERRRLRGDLPRFLIVVTPRRGTTASLVAKVRELRASMPDVVDSVFNAIGNIAMRGASCIESGDLLCVGRLMTMNHWLLASLGLSNQLVDALVRALSGAAYGAKMSGAGGGGVIVALPYTDSGKSIAEELGAEAINAGIWHGSG